MTSPFARAALAVLLFCAALASPAAAQTPVAPADGEEITDTTVTLRWTLEPGWYTHCVEWAYDPETTEDDGPFVETAGEACGLGPLDLTYRIGELLVAPYYWHVKVRREVCEVAEPTFDRCHVEELWGPVGHFDSIEAPAPPAPRGCTAGAAVRVGEEFLLAHARARSPRYYARRPVWTVRPPLCRDLDGDRDREMIVRLVRTRGALSPWAIFRHDAAGAWRMVYARVDDRVFGLSLRGRVVRAAVPAPNRGECTRHVRYRLVRWSGGRWRSSLSRRARYPRPRCR